MLRAFRERIAQSEALSTLIPLDESDPLARFLKKQQFSKEKQAVHTSAFTPPKNRRLSLFRTLGMTLRHIKELVKKNGEKGRRFFGYGKLTVENVLALNLPIDLDNSPARHVSVYMPDEDAVSLAKAQALASSSILVLFSQPIRP